MGTKMALTYVTVTLAYLEENLYEIIGEKYGNNIKEEFTKLWKRYLHDCFIFWKCQWGSINKLHNLLQNLLPKTKFTMEHRSKELPFLDILIKNVNGQIITDIYHRPTDTQQYLHFKSHHPQKCIKSIPYTLARRIHTIITDKNLKKLALKTYIQPKTREDTQQLRGPTYLKIFLFFGPTTYIYEVHTMGFLTFFVWAFEIGVDS